jgi:hypothetical protein
MHERPALRGSKSWLLLLAALLSAALAGIAVSGCGADEAQTTESPASRSPGEVDQKSPGEKQSLSREQFARKGNAICEEGTQTRLVARSRLPKRLSSKDLRRYVLEVEAPILKRQIGQILALKAPTSFRPVVRRLSRETVRGIAKLRAHPELVGQLRSLFAPTLLLAQQLGITACG